MTDYTNKNGIAKTSLNLFSNTTLPIGHKVTITASSAGLELLSTDIENVKLIADLSGNVTGTLTGDLSGNITGDVTGNVTGDLSGNVTGDVTGDLTGNVTGNVTGDVIPSPAFFGFSDGPADIDGLSINNAIIKLATVINHAFN